MLTAMKSSFRTRKERKDILLSTVIKLGKLGYSVRAISKIIQETTGIYVSHDTTYKWLKSVKGGK